MKAVILSLVLAAMALPVSLALAELAPKYDIYFPDGRVCRGCTYQLKQGYIASISHPQEGRWSITAGAQVITVPYIGMMEPGGKISYGPSFLPAERLRISPYLKH